MSPAVNNRSGERTMTDGSLLAVTAATFVGAAALYGYNVVTCTRRARAFLYLCCCVSCLMTAALAGLLYAYSGDASPWVLGVAVFAFAGALGSALLESDMRATDRDVAAAREAARVRAASAANVQQSLDSLRRLLADPDDDYIDRRPFD